jgi:hypothetical protein
MVRSSTLLPVVEVCFESNLIMYFFLPKNINNINFHNSSILYLVACKYLLHWAQLALFYSTDQCPYECRGREVESTTREVTLSKLLLVIFTIRYQSYPSISISKCHSLDLNNRSTQLTRIIEAETERLFIFHRFYNLKYVHCQV